ncbi:hypothetical protein K435DRAFT_874065 [Dendrothele bispora CBS 962.96]|uniref:Uncharacterized protein n=1 Tax=Dendrothele bispora (strain CBS 962.96) TaxID=1314807 RepID=A0A4S8KXK2_DENBC|nr:hypothetical protein K435DRAFT_874065 [Dendrothele bispora CBS 962.96]
MAADVSKASFSMVLSSKQMKIRGNRQKISRRVWLCEALPRAWPHTLMTRDRVTLNTLVQASVSNMVCHYSLVGVDAHKQLARFGELDGEFPVVGYEALDGIIVAKIAEVTEDGYKLEGNASTSKIAASAAQGEDGGIYLLEQSGLRSIERARATRVRIGKKKGRKVLRAVLDAASKKASSMELTLLRSQQVGYRAVES